MRYIIKAGDERHAETLHEYGDHLVAGSVAIIYHIIVYSYYYRENSYDQWKSS